MFPAHIKGKSRPRFIALQGVRYMRTWNVHNAGETLYIGIEAESTAFTTIGKQTTNHAK